MLKLSRVKALKTYLLSDRQFMRFKYIAERLSEWSFEVHIVFLNNFSVGKFSWL